MYKDFDNNLDGLKSFAYELVGSLRGNKNPIFLCVGSDKFICDSLAPMVAELLRKQYKINAFVYGGFDNIINAHNLTEAVNYIETFHPNSTIILIDATLGENVGKIRFTKGSYAGLGRSIPIKKIGDYSVLGVVGRNGKNFNLNSTRLKLVDSLAKFIAKGCAMAMWYLRLGEN